MSIMDILNFNFTEVTVIDIALISVSPIAIVVAIVKIVKSRSQISQFIRRWFQTIRILGKNVMTALQAGLRGEIIREAQPANISQWETGSRPSRRLTILQQPANINQEEIPEASLEPDLHDIREALIAYIDRESHSLKFDDFGRDEYIGYCCGYKRDSDYERGHIWLTTWIRPSDLGMIATRLMIGRDHRDTFERLEENQDKIEWLFPEEEVSYRSFSGDIKGIGVEKRVDLTQRENWHEVSVWVRENLEKLFYVIRIHDAIQESNTQESDTQEFEDDIPF